MFRSPYFLISILLITLLCQCKSNQIKFQDKPDFQIIKSYYQDFIGGQPGNSGTLVFLTVTTSTELMPDSLYFQNRVAVIESQTKENQKLWTARFQKTTLNEINLKENQNTNLSAEVPEMDAFPFKLQNDEAILLYHQNNTAYYYKLKGLIQKETIFFALNNPKN